MKKKNKCCYCQKQQPRYKMRAIEGHFNDIELACNKKYDKETGEYSIGCEGVTR